MPSNKTPENLKAFDARAIARHIKKGHVTQEQYKRFLDSLPDAADRMEVIDFDQDVEVALREEKRRDLRERQARFESLRGVSSETKNEQE